MSIVDIWGKKHQNKTLFQSDLDNDLHKVRRFKINNSHYLVKKGLEELDLIKIKKHSRAKSMDVTTAEKFFNHYA